MEGKQYSYEEFKEIVVAGVKTCFSDEVSVSMHKVLKNNSQEYDSMIIMAADKNISPNFYLNEYYNDYMEGKKVADILKDIVEKYYKTSKRSFGKIDMSFESCKNKIVCRLISREKNEKLLDTVPSIPFLDMAITFHCLMLENENGIGSIRITNQMMEEWKVNTKILYQIAIKNTQTIFPKVLCPLHNMLSSVICHTNSPFDFSDYVDAEDMIKGIDEPFVLTNSKGINGAAVILYPELLRKIAVTLENDFYILPSSIHEVLIIKNGGNFDFHELAEMVRNVNESCVLPEEVLSENVYYYSMEHNRVEICTDSMVS